VSLQRPMTSSGNCPLCYRWYSSRFLLLHAASCNGPKANVKRPRSTYASLDDAATDQRHGAWSSAPQALPSRDGLLPSERGAPGFHVFDDFVSLEEESIILSCVHTTPPSWDDLKVRRSKSYGPPYSLDQRRFMHETDGFPCTPLPAYVRNIVLPIVRERVPKSIYDGCPNQLVVHRYDATAGNAYIMPHSDCENTTMLDPILGLCLAGTATMTLILPRKSSVTGKLVKRDVLLPRRCLYVMSGESLHAWHHGIFPGKTVDIRYSLTFRRVAPLTQRQHDAAQGRLHQDITEVSPVVKRMKQTRFPN
jgi:alkylated DNA repair dioxygenase AlkB